MSKPVLAIDVDGVLTDTFPAWETHFAKRRCGKPHPSAPTEMYWDCWKDICRKCWNDVLHDPDVLYAHQLEFGAKAMLNVLAQQADLCVVTSRPLVNHSITDTWLIQRGIRDYFKGVFCADDKRWQCEALGAVALLDDAPKNLNQLFGSTVIPVIWDTKYNRSIEGIRVHNWVEAAYELLKLIR